MKRAWRQLTPNLWEGLSNYELPALYDKKCKTVRISEPGKYYDDHAVVIIRAESLDDATFIADKVEVVKTV